jgi:molecular chaperone DnaJ
MNPYDVLGVKKDATEKEIKKAYRDLCKEYHPDKGGDADKFKEIGNAYDILSNPEKKQNYDNFGDAKANPFSTGGFGGFGVDDLFSQFFGGANQQTIKKGSDEVIYIKLTLKEIMTGVTKTLNYKRNKQCNDCVGLGGDNPKKCNDCKGSGFVTEYYKTPIGQIQQQGKCKKCKDGYVFDNACKKCSGSGVVRKEETTSINIPPGVSTGSMSFKNAGNEIRDGITGDLVIRIQEIPESNFVRERNNLYTDIWISITDAVLGSEKVVTTPVTSFKFKVDAGCEHGKMYNFSGRGIPNVSPDGKNYGSGNLIVRVNVNIPKKLTKEQKELFDNLKKIEDAAV